MTRSVPAFDAWRECPPGNARWRAPSSSLSSARAVCFVIFLVALTATPFPAIAGDSPATSTGSELQLPPLPPAPKLEPPKPEAVEVEELDSRLQALYLPTSSERAQAARELLEVHPRLINAALSRLTRLAERADRERLKQALSSAKERQRQRSQNDDGENQDLLFLLLEQPGIKAPAYRDVLELVALVRVFARIGTVEAARGLVEVYARFGEFMRVDVQNRLFEMKDGAVAALIEARRHKADKIASWAERQLDRLGRAAPGEAIRTDNYEYLADILRAFGRTKDHDAARIVVSYANNERYQVREAARQAVVLLGDIGLWQLREAYEDVVGKRARRDWSWERTARELFYEYDRLHVAAVLGLFETGSKASRSGDCPTVLRAYDAVLARAPRFERANEMAQDYFACAERLAQTSPPEAVIALARVERLTSDSGLRARAQSLRTTLLAQARLETGVFDSHQLKAALERDPSNQKANALLVGFDARTVELLTRRVRWLTSGAIALVAALGIALVLFRRKAQNGVHGTPTAPTSPPTENVAQPGTPAPAPRSDLAPPEQQLASDLTAAQEASQPRDPFEGL